MATREENLKKINDELEKLTDEEIGNVTGGIVIKDLSYEDLLSKQGGIFKRGGTSYVHPDLVSGK